MVIDLYAFAKGRNVRRDEESHLLVGMLERVCCFDFEGDGSLAVRPGDVYYGDVGQSPFVVGP